MSRTAADILLEGLLQWGVDTVFGLPGDGINGIIGPVLIEATVDPDEPPLPPKTPFEFGKNFAEALARGTPGAAKILSNVAKEKARELI